MPAAVTQTEQQKRIAQVIDYLFKHTAEDVSVDTLAAVAHYSPDHLQKLFKQISGETPKQYSLKLQLETAALFLILYPDKPIGAIALDCGFSSPAAFSRAIKTYFGYSPVQFRALPHRQRMSILHNTRPHHPASHPADKRHPHQPAPPETFAPPDIGIVRYAPVNGIYQLTAFDDPDAIRKAFRTLTRYSQNVGIATPSFYGILSPLRRNSYRAFLPLDKTGDHPFPPCDIPGGTYANFSITGDLQTTKKAVHYFGHRWLPVNGYKIAGFEGFETFSEDPAGKPYSKLLRRIYIPIERRP